MNRLMLSKRWIVVLLAGAVIALCMLALSLLDHFTRQAPRYLTLFFAAFLLYLLAAGLLYQRRPPAGRSLLPLLFTLALLQRIPLLATTPTLSTDVWRYLWDGHLVASGLNPYAEPVNDPALDAYAIPIRGRVEHASMASPYPPAAQLAFAGAYRLAPDDPTAMQVVFTAFDLLTGAVLVLLLKRLRLPPQRVALYLWNPLIIVEFAHGAHVDSLMTFLVVLSLYLLLGGRKTGSALALALATLAKFVPALLLPVFIRRWGWRRTALYAGLLVVGWLPFAGAGLGLTGALEGRGLFGALRIYNTYWQTNDGLFQLLTRALALFSAQPASLARLLVLAVLGLVGAGVYWAGRAGSEEGLIHASLALISAYVLLAPVVFPWYLTWLLAALPLLRLRGRRPALLFALGWLYFSAAVNLSYLTYLDPLHPREIAWVRWVEYTPLWSALLAAFALWWGGRIRRDRALQAAPIE